MKSVLTSHGQKESKRPPLCAVDYIITTIAVRCRNPSLISFSKNNGGGEVLSQILSSEQFVTKELLLPRQLAKMEGGRRRFFPVGSMIKRFIHFKGTKWSFLAQKSVSKTLASYKTLAATGSSLEPSQTHCRAVIS
jgi:hypothetical protein